MIKKEDTPGRIEFMVKRFQEMIARCDDLEKNFADGMKSHQSMIETCLKPLDEVEKLKKSLELLFAMVDAYKNEQKNVNSSLASDWKKLEKDLEVLKKDSWNISIGQSQQAQSFQDLKKDLSNKTDIRSHVDLKNAMESKAQEISDKVVISEKKHSDSQIKTSSHDSDIAKLKDEFGKQYNDLQDNKNNILSIKEEVKQSFIKHKQEMEIAISGVYSALNKALANIPKPEVPSYDSLKQEVDKKLEPASLDAKNANLRSSNNEIKLVILEKKIEQLQLLLNKLQLQG